MFRRSGAIARVRLGPDSSVRTRRRSLQRALMAATVVLPAFATAAWTMSRQERIDHYWVAGRVDAEGNLAVREVIDYDFTVHPTEERHGILRDVDDPAVSQVAVSAPRGTPFDVEEFTDHTWIRIGDAARTVSGRERYALSYELGAVVADGAMVWDAIGAGWDVPIGTAEVHLLSDRDLSEVECSFGRRGRRGGCTFEEVAPGHLALTVHGLDEGTGVTVSAVVGERLATPPTDPSAGSPPLASWVAVILRWLGLVALSMTGAAVATGLLRWFGRERVFSETAAAAAFPPPVGTPADDTTVDAATLAEMAPSMVSPPTGLSAAQAGVVYDDRVLSRHVAAWLLAEVVAGTLALDMPADEAAPPRLRRLAPGRAEVAEILDGLFAAGDEVVLGPEAPTGLHRACAKITEQLSDWYSGSGLQPMDRKVLAAAAGTVGFAIGALSGAVMLFSGPAGNLVVDGIGWVPWVAAIVFGFGLAVGWGPEELVRNSAKRSAAWLQVESFRKFLAASEAAHITRAGQMGILREYAPWATALGLAGQWSTLGSTGGDGLPDRALLEALPRFSTWMAEIAASMPASASHDTHHDRDDDGRGFDGGGGWDDNGGGSGGGGTPLVGSGRGGGGGSSW